SALRAAAGDVLSARVDILAQRSLSGEIIQRIVDVAEMTTHTFLRDFAAATIGYAWLSECGADAPISFFINYASNRLARGGHIPRDLRTADALVSARLQDRSRADL